jgi:SAM-dependent methyltransferase
VRRFDPEYLRRTREGMWTDSRAALVDLELADRSRVLDVGCGTGKLTRVLAGEVPGEVVGLDADRSLLSVATSGTGEPEGDIGARSGTPETAGDRPASFVAGDALRLPFDDDAFDLVVCQALLINLPDPAAAVAEFARASSDLVAAIEPDNAAVTVESTVEAESTLEARARAAYLEGVETDVTLGAASEPFREAGLTVVSTRRYDHVRVVEPPYSDGALADAKRKATGAGLADDRATMLAGGVTDEEYDRLRARWRAMGRDVVAAMRDRTYRREETVPFYVTVGLV